jgi:hypothetical protein
MGKGLSKPGDIVSILTTRGYNEAIGRQIFSKEEPYPE